MAAYSIQGLATGTFTLEGLAFAGFMGVGMGAVGWGIGKLAMKINIGRFSKSFRDLEGASDIAAAASAGDQHAYGVVKASLRLGRGRVTGFGARGQPDIFVRSGLKNPSARWVEVKAGSVKPSQLHRYVAQYGQGEYAFYKLPWSVNPRGLAIFKNEGIPYWFTW